jgi:hypothetical protein
VVGSAEVGEVLRCCHVNSTAWDWAGARCWGRLYTTPAAAFQASKASSR